MNKLDELVNDYTLVGDDGAVIFPSFDGLLDFIEEIRQMEREACALACIEVGNDSALTGKQARVTTLCVNAILARGEK